MSVQINGAASPPPDTEHPTLSKTKKRKHDGKEGRHSSKKRKQEEARVPNEPVTPKAEDISPSPSEKKKSKKSKKSRALVAEEAATNGHELETSAAESPAEDEATTPQHPDLEASSEKKTKNKKKSRSKLDDGPPPEESSAPDDSTASADNDIEIPDAPPPASDTDALFSSQATIIADLLNDPSPSPFYSTRLSLLLSLPAIAISSTHALSSILATHLSPLLLKYFPPARGIVLAFSNPVLSARGSDALNGPLKPPSNPTSGSLDPTVVDATANKASKEVLSRASDEFGACWVWLTVTLLLFRPSRGDELTGWANVVSEGFVGVVGYNYFQAAVGKTRIPKGWRWMGATGQLAGQRKKPRKGRLGDGVLSQEADTAAPVHGERSDDDAGYFVDERGEKVPDVLSFRVVDTEMVPAHEAGSLSLQVDATLLDADAEESLLQDEREKFEKQQQGRLGNMSDNAVMSGGLASGR